MILAMSYKLAVETATWTPANAFLLFVGSVLFYLVFLLVYGNWVSYAPEFYGTVIVLAKTPLFWVILFVTPLSCVLFDVAAEYWRKTCWPK